MHATRSAWWPALCPPQQARPATWLRAEGTAAVFERPGDDDGPVVRGSAVKMPDNKQLGDMARTMVIRQLRELIDALDRRVPRLGATGETRIAQEAAALKRKAMERIAELASSARPLGSSGTRE